MGNDEKRFIDKQYSNTATIAHLDLSFAFLRCIGLLILASALYIMVLVKLPGYLKLPFYPSYAAFTFPFVITAIATKQSMDCLTKMGMAVAWLSPVVLVETIIAAVLVIYALVRYCMAVSKSLQAVQQ